VTTRYTREDSSDGQPVVYRAGKTTRRAWTLSWSNMSYVQSNWLQGFFITYVRGMLRPFTRYDADGTIRTVRLAAATITVKQLGFDRFSCDLPLIEDL
jgi:hypothetical protein